MAPISLFDVAHRRMAALLATGAPVFVCVNPVEYHGPHLSLHNDALISQGVAADLHARLAERARADWPFLLGTDLEIGVDPAPGPGTRRTSYRQARAAVEETCRALVASGAQRVVFVTWHGGALHGHAIEDGVRLLRAGGVAAASPFNVLLHKLVELGDPGAYADTVEGIADPQDRAAVLAGLDLDFHAGFFETSVTMHYAPDSVDPCVTALPDCPSWPEDPRLAAVARAARALGFHRAGTDLAFAARAAGWGALRPFPGYTGRPRLAHPAAGARFMAHALDEFVGAIEGSWAGRPAPTPTMGVLRALTLGGRLPLGGHLAQGQVLPAPEVAAGSAKMGA